MCCSCGSWWRIAAFKQVTLVHAGVHWWYWWLWLCAGTEEEFPLSRERLGAAALPRVPALHAGFVFSFAWLTSALPSVCGPHKLALLCYSSAWGLPDLAGVCKYLSQPQLHPLSMSRVHFEPSQGPSWTLPQDLTHTVSIPVFGGWILLQPACGFFKFKTFFFLMQISCGTTALLVLE